jgi:hypothetical protein
MTPAELRLQTIATMDAAHVPHAAKCISTGRTFENFSQASESGHFVGDSRSRRTKLRKKWLAGNRKATVMDNEEKVWCLADEWER